MMSAAERKNRRAGRVRSHGGTIVARVAFVIVERTAGERQTSTVKYLDVRPIFIPKRSKIERLAITPGGIQASGLTDGGPFTVVVLDFRLPGCRASSKETVERVQLEKFRSDYLRATAELPFEDVRRGQDPPDFVVRGATDSFGLDVAALALTERRLAYRLFDEFMRRIGTSQECCENLVGTHVLLWFSVGKGLPPKRSDRVLQDRITERLRTTRIDRSRVRAIVDEMSAERLPTPFPPGYPIHWLENQEAGFAIGLLPENHQLSPFAQRLGFECSLHMGMFVDHAFLSAELGRIVRKHDKPSIDWLVLCAGAPDADGWCHPGEEALFDLARLSQPVVTTSHLQRVFIHKWTTGEILVVQVTSTSERT